jgi:hypothetical protein
MDYLQSGAALRNRWWQFRWGWSTTDDRNKSGSRVKAMNEALFDLKDPRNVIYKYGEFDVLIMFAWEERSKKPSAARLNVTRKEPFAYAQMDQICDDWADIEDVAGRLKSAAKFIADGMTTGK